VKAANEGRVEVQREERREKRERKKQDLGSLSFWVWSGFLCVPTFPFPWVLLAITMMLPHTEEDVRKRE